MEINKSNVKGITLIALVVTIVVLLILAGTSISMLAGDNGIIRQAQEAKKETERAEVEEQVRLAIAAARIEGNGQIDKEILKTELGKLGYAGTNTDFPFEGTINGKEVTITEKGEVTVTGGTASSGGGNDSIAGKKFNSEEKITIGGQIVTVPGGATISRITGEYEDVNEGIVIYIIPQDEKTINWYADEDKDGILDVQEKYDQFVWVPVPNAILDLSKSPDALSTEANIKAAVNAEITAKRYPMAIKNADGNYFGVLYEFSEDSTTNTVKVEPYSGWTPLGTSHKEPSAVDGDDNILTRLQQVNGILNTSYSDSTSFESALKIEFNTMVNRVNNDKGFWVGRYETSGMRDDTTEIYENSNEVKVNVVKGTDIGIDEITWYRSYAQQQIYSKKVGLNATSSMIWGSQWDQIMIWMKEEPNERVTTNGNYYITNSLGYGNYYITSGTEEYDKETSKSAPAKTGASEYFKVKNIYDLAGNIDEKTLEAYADGYCAGRITRRR